MSRSCANGVYWCCSGLLSIKRNPMATVGRVARNRGDGKPSGLLRWVVGPKFWLGARWCKETLARCGLPRLGWELALEHHAMAGAVGQGEEGQEMVGQAKVQRGRWAERPAQGKGLRAAAEPSRWARGGLPRKRPLVGNAPGIGRSLSQVVIDYKKPLAISCWGM